MSSKHVRRGDVIEGSLIYKVLEQHALRIDGDGSCVCGWTGPDHVYHQVVWLRRKGCIRTKQSLWRRLIGDSPSVTQVQIAGPGSTGIQAGGNVTLHTGL